MCNWFTNKSPTHTFAVDCETWHCKWAAPCYFNGALPTGSLRWGYCLQWHLACEGLYRRHRCFDVGVVAPAQKRVGVGVGVGGWGWIFWLIIMKNGGLKSLNFPHFRKKKGGGKLYKYMNATLVTIIATLRWASCGPGTTGRPAQGCDYCNYIVPPVLSACWKMMWRFHLL